MANRGNALSMEEALDPFEDDYLESSNGSYRLNMQRDGNLVLYDRSNNPIWATNTKDKAVRLCVMEGDGNLVIYGDRAFAIWTSQTAGNLGAALKLEDDGNLVIYKASPPGGAIWSSNTAR